MKHLLLTLTLLLAGLQTSMGVLPPLEEREVECADTFSAIYLESVRQRLADHRDAAYELLQECLRINPDAPEALFDMAMLKLSVSALIDSTSVAEGDSLLRRAYAVDTTNADIRDQLARHLLARCDYPAATHLFEQICARRNPSTAELGVLCNLYYIQGLYQQSLATIDRIELMDGPDASTAWERFQVYQCLGQNEKAIQTFDSLLVKAMPDPTTPDYVLQHIVEHPRYYDKVKAHRERLAEAFAADDMQQVLLLTREGQAYEPHFLVYYYFEAYTHLMLGDTLQILDACRRGIDAITEPCDTAMAYNLYDLCGNTYTACGNIEAAVECYEEALRYDSTAISVLNNYAYQLALLGRDLERALVMSRQTVEAEPTNASYLDTLAWIYYRMGRRREARNYIDRAFRHAEEIDDTMREHRAAIYKMK